MGKLLYGYTLKKGKINICKKEAKYVKTIMQMCINENAPTQIAKWLNTNNISTLKQGGKWSHSMVTKMIQNLRYSGTDNFPGIVSRNEQLKAIHILENRKERKSRLQSASRNKASPFYKLIYCGECQQRMRLYKKRDIEYWKCTSIASTKQCITHQMDDYVKDDNLSNLTLALVNDLIKNVEQIIEVGQRERNLLKVVYIENEIKQLIKEETTEIQKLNQLIQEKSLMKYKELDNVFISETVALKKYINSLSIQEIGTQELVNQIFKKITIYCSGKVEYLLMNNQIIERNIKVERGKSHGKNTEK